MARDPGSDVALIKYWNREWAAAEKYYRERDHITQYGSVSVKKYLLLDDNCLVIDANDDIQEIRATAATYAIPVFIAKVVQKTKRAQIEFEDCE